MALDFTHGAEGCCIITFLVKEKPAAVLCRLKGQCRKETMSCGSDHDWNSKFSEGCNEALNLPHTHVQPMAVLGMNIQCIK
jgi:hypothetical protein